MHTANLVTIAEVKDVPPDILPFVQFKAEVEGMKLEQNEKVGVLVIDSTRCFIPVFLEKTTSMSELEEMLRKQDAELSKDAKQLLSKHLAR